MWIYRVLLLAAVLFVQLIFISEVLNQEEAGELTDTSWFATFAPLIVLIAAGVLFVLVTFVRAIINWMTPDARPATAMIEVDDDGEETSYYGGATRVVSSNYRLLVARIYFFDSLIDSVILVCLAVFVGLLIDQEIRIHDGVAGNERRWLAVLAPLFALLIFLLFILAFAAVRVCGEERFQRPLHNTGYCSAACGGVVVCCDVDHDSLSEGDRQRHDKRTEYAADHDYHELPCAFVCTPSMTYGISDFLLAWAFYLFLAVILIVLVLVAFLLDNTIASLQLDNIFIALYVIEGIIIFFSLFLLVELCFRWRGSPKRPRGRRNLAAKLWEGILSIIAISLLITQQALLVERIEQEDDALEERTDWHVVFIPLYILLGLILVFGCYTATCCGQSRIREANSLTDAQPTVGRRQFTVSSAGRPDGTRKRLVPMKPSSVWGVLQ